MDKTREYRLMLQKVKRDISGIVDLSGATIGKMDGSGMVEWGVVILALLIGLRLLTT